MQLLAVLVISTVLLSLVLLELFGNVCVLGFGNLATGRVTLDIGNITLGKT